MPTTIVITSNLTHPHIGGIENSIKHLADEGTKIGDTIIVISSNQRSTSHLKKEMHNNLLQAYHYNSHPKAPQPFRFVLNLISAIITYRKALKKYNPNITIARYHLNVIAARVAGLQNIIYLVPGVVRYQDNNINRNNSSSISVYINQISQRIAFSVSDRVAVFSDTMERQIKESRSGTIVYRVTPGVSLERFFQENKNATFSNDKIMLLCLGRLVPAKGINIAIEALSLLPSNYLLTIVGDGEERIRLETLTDRLKLRNRVHFVGSTNEPEQFYKKSDIFLFTSTYEPFGQTLLEATASKLPVVAFEPSNSVDTAIRQVLGENAFYASEPTKESLAKQIQRAHTETYLEKTFDIENLSNSITEKYSWKALYEELRNFQL